MNNHTNPNPNRTRRDSSGTGNSNRSNVPVPTSVDENLSPSYRYLITCQYRSGSGVGFVQLEYTLDRPISYMAQVGTLQDGLRAQGYPNALILGFSRFEDPVPDPSSVR